MLGRPQRLAMPGVDLLQKTITGMGVVGQPITLALEVVLPGAQFRRLCRIELEVDVSVGDGAGRGIDSVGGSGAGRGDDVGPPAGVRGLVARQMNMGTARGGCRGGEVDVMLVLTSRRGAGRRRGHAPAHESRAASSPDPRPFRTVRDDPPAPALVRPVDALHLEGPRGPTAEAEQFVSLLLLLLPDGEGGGGISRRGRRDAPEQVADGLGRLPPGIFFTCMG